MRAAIYAFVNQYVSYYEQSKKHKQVVPKLIEFYENSEVKRMLNVLENSDSTLYKTILKLDEDEMLYEYLKFVLTFYERKEFLRINSAKISSLTNIPTLTIRRFENLQFIAPFNMMLAIAKSVNLTLKWE